MSTFILTYGAWRGPGVGTKLFHYSNDGDIRFMRQTCLGMETAKSQSVRSLLGALDIRANIR